MAKQFPIPTRRDRFNPPVGPRGPQVVSPLILRNGVAVVIGEDAANPAVLSHPDGDCCCNSEVLGCSTCELTENEFFESAWHGCDDPFPPHWFLDDTFDCDNPNDHTLCCRTFLPTPYANVQMQTALGDFFFPNSCFSMKIILGLDPFHAFTQLVVNCCITVIGLRFNEAESKAETMQINIEASGSYVSTFANVQCDRIVDNSKGDETAFDNGFRINTNIVQWENVQHIGAFGILGCGLGGNGRFGNACIIKRKNGDIVGSVVESGFFPDVGLDTPYVWPFKRFFDSRDYLTDPSFTTQFQIVPEGVVDLGTEHTNAPC